MARKTASHITPAIKMKYDANPNGPRDIRTVSMLSASGSLEEYAAAQALAQSWKRIALMALVVIVPFGLPFLLLGLRLLFADSSP